MKEGFVRSEFGEDCRQCLTTSFAIVTNVSRNTQKQRIRFHSRLSVTWTSEQASVPSIILIFKHFRRFQIIEHSSRALHRDGNKGRSAEAAWESREDASGAVRNRTRLSRLTYRRARRMGEKRGKGERGTGEWKRNPRIIAGWFAAALLADNFGGMAIYGGRNERARIHLSNESSRYLGSSNAARNTAPVYNLRWTLLKLSAPVVN